MVALGVDRLARADHHVPPAGVLGIAVVAGGVRLAGQRVADHHRVRARGVERAVGLVGHLDGRQPSAGL